MDKQDKELLLKDLCARLPYGVKISTRIVGNTSFRDSELSGELLDDFIKKEWGEIKPYLRPMSSMTEEEHQELSRLVNDDKLLTGNPAKTVCLHCGVIIDFHNSHHLDWRGLIEKGLALEAPQDLYNNKFTNG